MSILNLIFDHFIFFFLIATNFSRKFSQNVFCSRRCEYFFFVMGSTWTIHIKIVKIRTYKILFSKHMLPSLPFVGLCYEKISLKRHYLDHWPLVGFVAVVNIAGVYVHLKFQNWNNCTIYRSYSDKTRRRQSSMCSLRMS